MVGLAFPHFVTLSITLHSLLFDLRCILTKMLMFSSGSYESEPKCVGFWFAIRLSRISNEWSTFHVYVQMSDITFAPICQRWWRRRKSQSSLCSWRIATSADIKLIKFRNTNCFFLLLFQGDRVLMMWNEGIGLLIAYTVPPTWLL